MGEWRRVVTTGILLSLWTVRFTNRGDQRLGSPLKPYSPYSLGDFKPACSLLSGAICWTKSNQLVPGATKGSSQGWEHARFGSTQSTAFPGSTSSKAWEDHSQHTEVYESRVISSPHAKKFKKGFDLRESSMDTLPSPTYVRKSSPSGSWRWNTMFSNTRCLFGLELPCSAITLSFCKWMIENVFFIFKYFPLQVTFKDTLRYLIYTLISLR